MSRIANQPINLNNVKAEIAGQLLKVTGTKGSLSMTLHPYIGIEQADNVMKVVIKIKTPESVALAGTMRAIASNLVKGVSEGFERKLTLIGVGYRAQVQGRKLNLSLGLSHPVVFDIPEGVTIEAPTQTELVVKGMDKQQVGQVAANIRAYRPPEPYKGKGIRYADERVVIKETKKK